MKPNNKRQLTHQTRLTHDAGFSLIEIMVGLVIGMLASMVIMQVFSVFEAQKRTTTGTADAQTNGNIALYTIGRELNIAGYPLMPYTNSPLRCTTLNTVGPPPPGVTDIFPVTITDGGVNGNDSITVRYGDSGSGGVATPICATAGAVMTVGAGTTLCSGNNFGCRPNDIAIVTNAANCDVAKVTALTAANVTPATITLAYAPPNAIPQANLACLGTWHEVTYRINGGNLERQDIASPPLDPLVPVPPFVPIVPGIVNLQAQYGVIDLTSANANANQIVQWVDATGATWAAPLPPSAAVPNRNFIKAIHIAVVARNAKKETAVVTTACSSRTAPNPTGLCAWQGSASSPAPTVNLGASDPNWSKYRYRVFETVVPVRNAQWRP